MKSKKGISSFTPNEVRRFVLPVTLASIGTLVATIAQGFLGGADANPYLATVGVLLITQILFVNLSIVRFGHLREIYGVLNAAFSGLGLGLLTHLLPEHLAEISHFLIIFGAIASATLSGRLHTYIVVLLALLISLPLHRASLTSGGSILHFISPFVISVVVVEAVVRILGATRTQIHRLETINIVSRKLMLSLEPKETLGLIDAAIRDALRADFYFLGIVRGEDIHLELLHDQGENIEGVQVPLEGTLSGWVIQNQRELFLPDLRRASQLEGVTLSARGGEQRGLSWMGVHLTAIHFKGVIALGSYAPNAFDKADMELLSNLAHRISLALDNVARHAELEQQASLDSLTGVYNHGAFLKRLETQAEETLRSALPLSLIMLDIDYFKRYNDTFGHLLGDRILTELCAIIRRHIKQNDAVGRWGGEEFIISLPGATGDQALQVAQRIGETLRLLEVADREGNRVPTPTVSQGIAVCPSEANDIFRLIDLADRRLYVAKQRGRNQIEPPALPDGLLPGSA